jgi:MEDS: MEthanogen/methylotroph, DcmR Sensory domain
MKAAFCSRLDGDTVTTGIEVHRAARGGHVVLFYRDEQELADRVSEYLLPAVTDGDGAAIVIATPDHRRSFTERLAGAGVDVAAARARGSYLELDANETIRGFMVGDRPDPAGFWQLVSPLLQEAAQARRPVLVFGEMVSLLWDAGLVHAAIEVEEMWNELGGQYPFSLLCAYPARPVTCSHYLDALTEVCRAHTEVTGSPPEPELAHPPGS